MAWEHMEKKHVLMGKNVGFFLVSVEISMSKNMNPCLMV